jgi:hypothetical protein
MKKPNTIKRDIAEIRLKIYEETKGFTAEQFNDYFRKKAEIMAKKYKFKRAATAQSEVYEG